MNDSYMVRYIIYRLRKYLLLIAGIALISFILGNRSIIIHYLWNDELNFSLHSVNTFMIYMAFVMPCIVFSLFKKPRNIDTLYSFGLAREKMNLIHYLSGLSMILISDIVLLLSMLIRVSGSEKYGNAAPYVFRYILLAGLTQIAVYSVSSFAYIVANNRLDGIIMEVLYYLLPVSIGELIAGIVASGNNGLYDDMDVYRSFNPLSVMTSIYYHYECLIEERKDPFEIDYSAPFIWSAIGLIAVIGLYLIVKHRRAEKTGGITDSPFGYPYLLPAILYPYMLLSSNHSLKITILIVLICGYFFGRRGLKLLKSQWIIVGIGLVLAILPFSVID